MRASPARPMARGSQIATTCCRNRLEGRLCHVAGRVAVARSGVFFMAGLAVRSALSSARRSNGCSSHDDVGRQCPSNLCESALAPKSSRARTCFIPVRSGPARASRLPDRRFCRLRHGAVRRSCLSPWDRHAGSGAKLRPDLNVRRCEPRPPSACGRHVG